MWRQSQSLTDTSSSSSSLGAYFIRVRRSVNRAVACFYQGICHQRGYKQGKGKQFNKPRATLFSKKKELPWVGFEPTLDSYTAFLEQRALNRHFTEFRAHASAVVSRPFFLRPGYDAIPDIVNLECVSRHNRALGCASCSISSRHIPHSLYPVVHSHGYIN